MKTSWAQPSLSRDFALLAAAILFVLLMVSAWVSYTTYVRYSDRIAHDLERESARIERMISNQMDNANYMLNAVGRQIILEDNYDLIRVAQILKSFDSRGYIYSIFSFLNKKQEIVISSNKGVLEKPVDISDSDYVRMAAAEPWKMHIGKPVEGRVSGRWGIPVAMGITDYTGKFIGSVLISIDINTLTDALSDLIRRDGLSFAIVSTTLVPLTQVSEDKDFVTNNFPIQKLVNVDFTENPSGIVTKGSLFVGDSRYAYYRVSKVFPYIMLLGYDADSSNDNVRNQLWSRLLQILGFATFFVMFLWIMRARMISPVLDLTALASSVANGQAHKPLSQTGPVEIEGLAREIGRISDFITETQRIEDELRNKMFLLKRQKEQAELEKINKSEFLTYICQELRAQINSVLGFAQLMKDQLYGPIENRKYRQCAADIYQTSNSVMEQLTRLLDFSRTEMAKRNLNEKPLDVAGIIQNSLRILTERLKTLPTEIQVDIERDLPRLMADEFVLQQIMLNLLSHCISQAEPSTSMKIESFINQSSNGRYFVISVNRFFAPSKPVPASFNRDNGQTQLDQLMQEGKLNFEMVKILVDTHQANLEHIQKSDSEKFNIYFAANRIVPNTRYDIDQDDI